MIFSIFYQINLIEINIKFFTSLRDVLNSGYIVIDEIESSQVAEFQSQWVDFVELLLNETKRLIKIEKKFFVTDVLGHSILENELIQFEIVFTPLLDLIYLLSTASNETTKSY